METASHKNRSTIKISKKKTMLLFENRKSLQRGSYLGVFHTLAHI